MTTTERIILEIIAGCLLLFGISLYLEHLGAQRIELADEKADLADAKRVQSETDLAKEKSDSADRESDHVQQAVDAYRSSHPDSPVRLCHENSSGLPSSHPAGSQAASSVTGPAAVPKVPGRSEGPDISPELDAIVQAAQRLAIINADWQQRLTP